MTRPTSKVASGWWDYTTLDPDLLSAAAKLSPADVASMSRPGFTVRTYPSIEEFYLAEAMEYIAAWRMATPEQPAGICGPIGPTEQLPLAARLVNDLELSLRHAHFWAMDEWVLDGEVATPDFMLSFARTNLKLCFDRIRPDLAMPAENIHFPGDDMREYITSWTHARCLIMQGGQGEVKHWAFNEPPRRKGAFVDLPPSPDEYRSLGTRIVDLHPMTLLQNARTSAGGALHAVPDQAVTVGPKETWMADRVSIWHAGNHDTPFGMRLSTLMLTERIVDTSVPISLLADHPDVTFNFLQSGIGTCAVDMH